MFWQQTALLQFRRQLCWVYLPFCLLLLLLPFTTVTAQQAQQSNAPVSVLIDQVDYDPSSNEYQVTISIAWPDEINQLQISLEEAEGGKHILGFPLNVNRRNSLQTTFSGAELRAERAYLLTIQGTDFGGVRILKPAESGTDSTAERVILATHNFTHEPPAAAGLPVKIVSVNVEYEAQRILIMLNLENTELARLERYAGYIKHKETGAQVHTIEPQLFRGLPIIEALPASMQNPTTAQSYELFLTLTTSEDLSSTNEEPYAFTPPLPSQLTRSERLLSALNSAWLWIAILVIIISTFSWISLQKSQENRSESLPPVFEQTGRYQSYKAAAHAKPGHRVQVTLLSTPDKRISVDEVFTDFPITIGREGCTINIPGDRQISRQHLRIDRHQDKLALFDLDSSNGTSVAHATVVPNKPWPLKSVSNVKLGHHTEIRIEILS